LALEVNAAAKVELQVIVEQIRNLNDWIAKLDQEMTDRGKKTDYEYQGHRFKEWDDLVEHYL